MGEMVVTGDRCRLWTARSGTGDPLVLCHGGPGFWDTFGGLAGLLADTVTVVRWDQRGCGRSERRGPYTVARALADLDAVRRHHGLTRMALLGHSWGAELALRYTLAHPGRVTRLAYVSGVGVDPEATWHDEFERNLLDRRPPGALAAAATEQPALARRGAGGGRPAALGRVRRPGPALEHAERQTTPFLGVNDECNRALNADRRRSVDNGQLLRGCQALQVPVLLVDGALDLRPRWAVDSLKRAPVSAPCRPGRRPPALGRGPGRLPRGRDRVPVRRLDEHAGHGRVEEVG